MSKHPLQTALEHLRDYEFDCEYKVRSYSGRGMYGKDCLAITGDDINPFVIGFLIAQYNVEFEEDDAELVVDVSDISNYRQDNMGRGSVFYWPSIPFVGDETNEEEDE